MQHGQWLLDCTLDIFVNSQVHQPTT